MSESNAAPAGFKPKKSVALSGTPAGKPRYAPSAAAATTCTIAATTSSIWRRTASLKKSRYLLVHGKLPTRPELAAYKEQAA